jgi:hypothetical protein
MSASELVVTLADGERLVWAPSIPEALPPLLREGLARRTLVATGEGCPCGATIPRLNRAERRASRSVPLRVEVRHESGCPAISSELEAYLRGIR